MTFFIKHHLIFLFILLEGLSLYFLFQRNRFHKSAFLNFMDEFNGSIYQRVVNTKKYFSLQEENKKLVQENLALRKQIIDYSTTLKRQLNQDLPEINSDQFELNHAYVIKNSVNKQYNYITLNKGEKDGLKANMGIISRNGVVGIIKSTSTNFSNVISLLNRDLIISAKLKNSEYFGPLRWEGGNYRIAILRDIPYHVNLEIGDTIITSGYSAIFPEGIVIGTIREFRVEGGNFFRIEVELSADFKHLTHVYVIKNKGRKEQIELEVKSEQNG